MNTTYIPPASDKLIIYQIFTRLFGNTNTTNVVNGTLAQNGSGKFSDINDAALRSLRQFGVSHIWYTGVPEHATQTDYSAFGIRPDDPAIVKGRAGSPYAVKDYYDVDPDLADDVPNRMAEFEALVQRTHAHGMKVILDFVPNHVARQYHSDAKPANVVDLGANDDTNVAFSPQNNFYYLPGRAFRAPEPSATLVENPAKITGSGSLTEAPDVNDWYETVKLNYGYNVFDGTLHVDPQPATWAQMLDILLFWAEKGVDGFRCDMAHLVPVAFWRWATAQVRQRYPNTIFIAEIYDPGLYRSFIFDGGFDYLYDKVGLYDSLRRLIEGHGSVRDITRVWQQESGDYAEHMLRFLETHDEQRIASKFFAPGEPLRAVPAMLVTATLHTGPYLLYFGQEVGVRAEGSEGFSGDDGRTTIFDYWGVPEWQGYINNRDGGPNRYDGAGLTDEQRRTRAFYQQLNVLVNQSDAIRNGAFYDLQWANQATAGYNQDQHFAYLRHSAGQKLLFVANFDQQNALMANLVVPDHAWQTMGLDPAGTYRFQDVFLAEYDHRSPARLGIPVELPPLGVLVLEITA